MEITLPETIEDAKEELAALFFQCARYERQSTDWMRALDMFTEQVATAAVELDRAHRGEPVAWGMPRVDGVILDVVCPDEHENHEGEYTVPLYTVPQPAHTEADAQEILSSALREFGVFEQTVRSILNVEKP